MKRFLPKLFCPAAVFSLFLAFPIQAQTLYDPGQIYSGIVPGNGSVATCETVANGQSETSCDAHYDLSAKKMHAHVYASELGDSNAKTAVSLFHDFIISTGASGENVVLNGSLIYIDVEWHGLLVGIGPKGRGKFKVEVIVADRTTNRQVGYHLIGSRDVSGSVKLQTIKGVPFPVPSPEFSQERESAIQAAIPIALTRGHAYRVALRLETEAWGSLTSAGEVHFSPAPGGPLFGIGAQDRFVHWADMEVSVGEDRFDALETRVDDLESDVAGLQNTVGDLEDYVSDLQNDIYDLTELLNNHRHSYKTGPGRGHNKIEALTTPPDS